MEPAIASAFAQFGAAGLIGWMWLAERRAAAIREKQLADLHERLQEERPQISTLIAVVKDNTRALTALEVGQRTLTTLLERTNPSPPLQHIRESPAHFRNEPGTQ